MITETERTRARKELALKERNLQEALRHAGILTEPPRNREELAAFSTNLEREERNHQASKQMLIAVSAALGRLNDGTWGVCVNCGEEISEDRRNAMCWASRCKPCQEKKGLRIR